MTFSPAWILPGLLLLALVGRFFGLGDLVVRLCDRLYLGRYRRELGPLGKDQTGLLGYFGVTEQVLLVYSPPDYKPALVIRQHGWFFFTGSIAYQPLPLERLQQLRAYAEQAETLIREDPLIPDLDRQKRAKQIAVLGTGLLLFGWLATAALVDRGTLDYLPASLFCGLPLAVLGYNLLLAWLR